MIEPKTKGRRDGGDGGARGRDLARELEVLLDGLTEAYAGLGEGVEMQRAAVRKADGRGVGAAAAAQERWQVRVSELDRTRRELLPLVVSRWRGLAGRHPASLTLRDVAAAAEDRATRERLMGKAAALRERVAEVGRGSASVAEATRTVVSHLEALVRQVGGRMSHGGVYSRRGVVEPGGMVVSGLDTRR